MKGTYHMYTHVGSEKIACDSGASFWSKMEKPPVSSSPYKVEGHNGVWQLSTKNGAIRIHNSCVQDPLQHTKGGVVRTIAADDQELQDLARQDARLLLALHLNVPIESVYRDTDPSVGQIDRRRTELV